LSYEAPASYDDWENSLTITEDGYRLGKNTQK